MVQGSNQDFGFHADNAWPPKAKQRQNGPPLFRYIALLIGQWFLLSFYLLLLADRWQASNTPPCARFHDLITKAQNVVLTMLVISQALAVGHALSFTLALIITCYSTQLFVGTGSCPWSTSAGEQASSAALTRPASLLPLPWVGSVWKFTCIRRLYNYDC